jgi:E3 ubiquitin-protein ligase HUWE1
MRSETAAGTIRSLDTLKKMFMTIEARADDCISDYTNNGSASINSLRFISRSLSYLIQVLEGGNADGFMNLLDTDFPHIIKKLLDHNKAFSPNIYASAISIITKFINREPTSLSVLQEVQVPQALLQSFNNYSQPTFKILKNAILSFDIMCLNSDGRRIFQDLNPLPHYFELLVQLDFVRTSSDDSEIGFLGVCLDELIRHHPHLESNIYQLLDNLIMYVIEIGNTESCKPVDNRHKLHLASERDVYDRNNTSCPLLDYVNLVAEVKKQNYLYNILTFKCTNI